MFCCTQLLVFPIQCGIKGAGREKYWKSLSPLFSQFEEGQGYSANAQTIISEFHFIL